MPKLESDVLIEAGKPYALRLNMAKALALATQINGGPVSFRSFTADGSETCQPAFPERWGDVVLARKDSPASYHLAVTADDALQGVTHITRGMDLLDATGIHRLLQILLKLPEPVYCHHPLIVDETGRKLSKSHRDKSIRSMRAEGLTRDAVIQLAGLPGG
jgi:glutamyl-Q tRNA(Asp) synthetase